MTVPDEKTPLKINGSSRICHSGRPWILQKSLFCRASLTCVGPVIEADPESMLEMERTHEYSGTDAHAGVDSGSASEFEHNLFADSEDGSNAPPCWRPPGMTGLGAV